MPRRQVTIPITNAFRVATPDILRQILLYATTSTLASCVRVSQNFYHVAAPILYQDVVFHNDNLHFLEGFDVKPKAVSTRSAPKVTNLKLPLLQHIKTVTTTVYEHRPHRNATEPSLSTFNFPFLSMPRFDTIRVRFQSIPRCQLCATYHCVYNCSNPILKQRFFKKLVLLPSNHLWSSLLDWNIAHTDFGTLTVVMSSYDVYPAVDVVRKIIRRIRMVKLRIIFCSWNQHEDLRAKELGAGEDPELESDSSESRLMLLVYSFSRYTNVESHVYFIEPPCDKSHHPERPSIFPTKARAKELFEAFGAEWNNGMGINKGTVVFKDRKDYLMEGVTDEVELEELAEWKRIQNWEDQASFYDQYHPVILDQQREQLEYYAKHPDIIPVAQLIEEYQIDPDILFLAEEERRAAAEELAQWIDEGVTMILVQELVYRHHFYNIFYPSRKPHKSQCVTTNHPNRLPAPEPVADA